MNKECSKCKTIKPVENFTPRKRSSDGFFPHCKACERLYRREWRKKNPSSVKKSNDNWTRKNPELRKQKSKMWRDKNRRRFRELCKIYYAENKDKKIQESIKRFEKNVEHNKLIRKVYRKKAAGKINHLNKKREALKRQATPLWLTRDDLEKIKMVYEKAKWLESVTGIKYDVDHVIPLNGKNVCGLHVWENLQILDASLNRRKSNKF